MADETDVPDIDLGGDENTRNNTYNLILWLPFILIPSSILLVRCIKYSYRYLKVSHKCVKIQFIFDLDQEGWPGCIDAWP